MATYSQFDDTSEDYTQYDCTVCLNNSKVKNADRYCFDCQKYMCPECLQIHNKFGDKHNVLSVSDKRVKIILTEKCEAHPDKVLEFYCRRHDAVLCQRCLLLNHRACYDVKHIGESVDDLTADPDILAIPGHLQSALDHVNQVMEALDKHEERIREKKEIYLNGLEEYLRTILSKIEEMRKREIEEISDTHQKLTTKAKENRQACKNIKAVLSKRASEIERSKDRHAHLIVLKKKSQAIARKAESLCEESERMIEETPFNFIFNMSLVEELDKCNSLFVNVKKHTFNIMNPQDRSECSNVHDCCCLKDGTIMLLDVTNKRLKCLDPVSNTVTEGPSLLGFVEVYSMCSVGPQQLAVAGMVAEMDEDLMEQYWEAKGRQGAKGRKHAKGRKDTGRLSPNIRYIQCIGFYDVSKGTKTKRIHMDHPISCLACHSGYLFVGSSGSLHVYNMNDTQKQEIGKDSSGRSLFSSLESITVNKGGDRIYVADRNMGLICLSRDGQEIFRLTNEQLGLSSATGVTTFHRNQVLICSYDLQKLVQVTEKGWVIGGILSMKDDIKNPRCMCFDDVRKKFYVGGGIGHVLGFDFM